MMLCNPDDEKELAVFEQEWRACYTKRNPLMMPSIHSLRSLWGYATEGHVPGDFILGILENNLQATYANARASEIEEIHGLTQYVAITMPQAAHGSVEKVGKWLTETKKSKMYKPTKHY